MDPYTYYQQQSSYDPSQSYNQLTPSYYTPTSTYTINNQQYPYDNNHHYTQYYIDPSYHPQQYPNEPTLIRPPGVPIQPYPTHLDPTHHQDVNTPYLQGSYGVGAVALQTHHVPEVY